MRIGLVVERLDPRRGGVEQWTYQFARQLLHTGHEVHLVASQFGPAAGELAIEQHQLEPTRSRIGFAEAAAARLATLPIDIVHDTGAGWSCDVFQPHGGSRRASFEQNLLLERPWRRPVKRAAARWLPRYRQFDRLNARQYADDGRLFVAISQMVARDLVRYHGVRHERLHVVYNGVDLERFSPRWRGVHRATIRRQLNVRPDEVLLLIVAHNFELKGVPVLVRATGRLVREGYPLRLVVAGGKRIGRYERMATAIGAAGAVTLLGSVDDPVPYYAAADAYVQPTLYDPCSLVVLEALASGLPVITSRFNGAGELIEPGREGLLLDDPCDIDELVGQLRELIEPERRQQMGAAARQLACGHSFAHNAAEMVAVYEEAVAARRRAAA